jgi:hypothetical protein
MKKKAGWLVSELPCLPQGTHHHCRKNLRPRLRQCIRENHLMEKLFLRLVKMARDGRKTTTHQGTHQKARD